MTESVYNSLTDGFYRILRNNIVFGLACNANGLPSVAFDKGQRILKLPQDVALKGLFVNKIYRIGSLESRTFDLGFNKIILRTLAKQKNCGIIKHAPGDDTKILAQIIQGGVKRYFRSVKEFLDRLPINVLGHERFA